MSLKPKFEKLLQKKLAPNRHIQCEETNVTVYVTDRTKHDLVKRFDDVDIDWSPVVKQLVNWGELFWSGKKLERIFRSIIQTPIYHRLALNDEETS
jgi:hypothetical protein